jgi:hypothetical protein
VNGGQEIVVACFNALPDICLTSLGDNTEKRSAKAVDNLIEIRIVYLWNIILDTAT